MPSAIAMRRHDRTLGHDCIGAHDRVGPDLDPVEHDRPRSDQRPIADHAPLHVNGVADHALGTDPSRMSRRRVDDRAVLHRRSHSHRDRRVVTSEHRSWPDRRVGSQGDGADHDGVRVHVGGRVDRRFEIAEGVDRHRSVSVGRQGTPVDGDPQEANRPYPPLKNKSGPAGPSPSASRAMTSPITRK